MSSPVSTVRIRSVALWGATTAAAVGVGTVTLPTLARGAVPAATGARFTELLVTVCAAATAVATGWLWVITTDVVVGVLRARSGGLVVRRPGAVRAALLVACGVVALGAPATADDRPPVDRPPVGPPSLSGLPLPDRATSDASTSGPEAPASHQVRVRPGDSLWAIAERRLGPRASVVEVVGYWQRIYDRNAAVIGPDPDLILPGQLLELPPPG